MDDLYIIEYSTCGRSACYFHLEPAEQPQKDEFITSYRADMMYDVEQHDTVARA